MDSGKDNNKVDRRSLRKQREFEAHRREILEAAERVFGSAGFHEATVEEIAGEAGFSVGTLYNFFAGKEELYQEVIRSVAEGFMEAFDREVAGQEDPAEAVRRLIGLRLRYYRQHRGIFRVFLQADKLAVRSADSLPNNCRALHERYTSEVTGILWKGIEEKVFDEFDPVYLMLSLEGVINAFIRYWTRFEVPEDVEERIELFQEDFVERIKIKVRGSDGK